MGRRKVKVPPKKSVYVNVETVSQFGRDIFEGIKTFALENNWEVYFESRTLTERLPDWFRHWGEWDGVISRSGTRAIYEEIAAKNCPMVELVGMSDSDEPEVMVDREKVARMIFEHFYGCGFRYFAVFATEDTWWSRLEKEAYRSILAERGYGVDIFPVRSTSALVPKWDEEKRGRLRQWLTDLPKPVALYVITDMQAVPIYQTCREMGLRIPRDVAIVSVENDEWLCNVIDPHLSSVDQNGKKIGYLAAELLSDRMQGRRLKRQAIKVPPKRLLIRESSKYATVDDPDLVEILHYIQETACNGLTVDELIAYSNYSHATLGRLFKKNLHRTIEDEIRRVRVERAKSLLLETQASITSIASSCGFSSPEYFCHVFRSITGMSPSKYRSCK